MRGYFVLKATGEPRYFGLRGDAQKLESTCDFVTTPMPAERPSRINSFDDYWWVNGQWELQKDVRKPSDAQMVQTIKSGDRNKVIFRLLLSLINDVRGIKEYLRDQGATADQLSRNQITMAQLDQRINQERKR